MSDRVDAVVGYYVHHVGSGHLHRATVLARQLAGTGVRVTGLSSLPRPPAWQGEWVELPRDDDGEPADVTAHGHLHWAPLRHAGTRERAARLSAWIAAARPDLVVVDVSVETLLLARLHGVPTMAVVLPGRRDDPAHLLGLGTAGSLVAFWPEQAEEMSPGLPDELRARLVPLGALSRHPVRPVRPVHGTGGRTVAVLLGTGGHDVSAARLDAARAATPGWTWQVLGADRATWVEDPSAVLAASDVVITHAGQNALAETAAARRPAVVVPQERPHDEQVTTGRVLADGWPAVVLDTWPEEGWDQVLERAAGLDGAGWSAWCDGRAAERFADLVVAAVAA